METIAIEGNGSRPSHSGTGYHEWGVMFTLNATEVHAVCYRLCSKQSNSMKSDNPHSGIYETDISSTLDCISTMTPTCSQGGVAIVFEGQNASANDTVSPTLLAGRSDTHYVPCVCKKVDDGVISLGHDVRSCQFVQGVADPLTATDYKQPTIIAYERR